MSVPVNGPLQAVVAAVDAGVNTRPELRRTVNFPDDVVDAALDHLIRSGHITVQSLTLGCVSVSCGGCPLASGCQSQPVSSGTCQS